MMRFIVISRLEFHRLAALRNGTSASPAAAGDFYASMVDDAIERRELPDDTDAAAVVSMLLAMSWGVGFYAGFVRDADDVIAIAKQLLRLFARGLLDGVRSARSLTIDPHAPAAVEAFTRTWPGLTLVLDIPDGQPFISADRAQPVGERRLHPRAGAQRAPPRVPGRVLRGGHRPLRQPRRRHPGLMFLRETPDSSRPASQ